MSLLNSKKVMQCRDLKQKTEITVIERSSSLKFDMWLYTGWPLERGGKDNQRDEEAEIIPIVRRKWNNHQSGKS